MVGFLITWFVNAVALIAVVKVMPGIHVDDGATILIAALILGFLNAFLRPFVFLMMFPLYFVSFGIFTLFVNGFLFYMVSKVVEGFYVMNFWSAFWGALVFSIISFILNLFVSPEGRVNMRFHSKYSFRNNDPHIIDVEGKAKDDQDNRRPRIDRL